jgi:uncharacterized protein YidB (DUF937 family)
MASAYRARQLSPLGEIPCGLVGQAVAAAFVYRDAPPPPLKPDASPGEVIGGLGGLLKQFQQNGFGDEINSWVGTGQNKPVAPNQISDALGQDTIDALSQRTGLPKDQILVVLSKVLPNTVDQLTPEGRLPTRQEISRLMG